MRKVIYLITLLAASCSNNQDKTPSVKEQIREQMLIFASTNLQMSRQMISAPDDIKESIAPLIDKAISYGNLANELNQNSKLNKTQLLDSLRSLEIAQQLIIKQATEIEIQYIKEH